MEEMAIKANENELEHQLCSNRFFALNQRIKKILIRKLYTCIEILYQISS